MVAVADEVQVADLVDLDRGEDGACPAGPVQCFPSLAVDRSTWAEPAVEVAHAADATDDGVDVEVVESEVAPACVAEWAHDVVEVQQFGLLVGTMT